MHKLFKHLIKLVFVFSIISKEADMALFQYVQSRRYKRIQKLMKRVEKLKTKREKLRSDFERDNLSRYL